MPQDEKTREYTRGEMREATLNNYNAGWNAAIDAIKAIVDEAVAGHGPRVLDYLPEAIWKLRR